MSESNRWGFSLSESEWDKVFPYESALQAKYHGLEACQREGVSVFYIGRVEDRVASDSLTIDAQGVIDSFAYQIEEEGATVLADEFYEVASVKENVDALQTVLDEVSKQWLKRFNLRYLYVADIQKVVCSPAGEKEGE